MANTTFKGTLRSEGGYSSIATAASTGAETTQMSITSAGFASLDANTMAVEAGTGITTGSGTSDNDVNAVKNMGMLPEGYVINHFLTDTDAFFIKTDAPNGFKYFERTPLSTSMEADFDTGNMRYKARERYAFGFSDPRCVFGSPGAA